MEAEIKKLEAALSLIKKVIEPFMKEHPDFKWR